MLPAEVPVAATVDLRSSLVILIVKGIPYCVLKAHVNFKRFAASRFLPITGVRVVAAYACSRFRAGRNRIALAQKRVRRLPMIRAGQFVTAEAAKPLREAALKGPQLCCPPRLPIASEFSRSRRLRSAISSRSTATSRGALMPIRTCVPFTAMTVTSISSPIRNASPARLVNISIGLLRCSGCCVGWLGSLDCSPDQTPTMWAYGSIGCRTQEDSFCNR